MLLSIYRNGALHLNINIDEDSNVVENLNSGNVATVKFNKPAKVDLQINDYIDVYSKRYVLNTLPELKESSHYFEYTARFEGRMFELGKAQYFDGINTEFQLTGDLDFFVDLIVSNMNSARMGQSGWAKGTVKASTETKTLPFSRQSCLNVMQYLAQEYKLDWYVAENKAINIGEFGSLLADTFKYGQSNGLYELTRKTVDPKNIVTRLFPTGGSQNLPANYRDYSNKLKISGDYIEKNVSIYGPLEAGYPFEDIYPRFIGAVTSVPAFNTFQVSSLDFDLNSYLVAGMPAKVHFNSGQLAGYEFEIVTYTHASKEFVLKLNEDEKTIGVVGSLEPYKIPNVTIKPAIGDEIVFLGITMPQSYIDEAEARLLTAANEYLNQNCDPRVNYDLDIDRFFVRSHSISIGAGDYVKVQDTDLGVDRYIRVTKVERKITDQYYYKVDLSDFTSPQIIDRMIADLEEIRQFLVINKLDNIARAKRNWRVGEEIRNMIFDPDGYFTDKIRPLAIETTHLKLGSRSGNLSLSCVFEPNYLQDKNKIRFGEGKLVHFQIEYPVIKTWNITETIQTGLIDATPYYIYARCNRANSAGILIAETAQRQVDSDATYYYFLVGNLTSVIDEWREAVPSYGYAYMTGNRLKVGKIIGNGGLVIDMDQGTFTGVATFLPGSSGFGNIGDFDVDVSNLNMKSFIHKKTKAGDNGGIIPYYCTVADAEFGTVRRFTATTSDPQLEITSGLPGMDTYVIRARIRLNTDSWQGTCYFAVSGGHGYSENYRKTIVKPKLDVWTIVEWDLRSLTVGGQDYLNSQVITSIRLDLCATTGASVDVDWISIGIYGNINDSDIQEKGKVFNSQPVPPYRIGDLWVNGTDIKRCVTTRLSGSYNAADWSLASNYDRTKTVIDGGLITTGRIEVGGFQLGINNAGINGSGTLSTSVRIWAGGSYSDAVAGAVPFRVLQSGVAYIFSAVIGGWTIDTDSMFAGQKQSGDGYQLSGMTIHSNGSIHSPNFYINSDGKVAFRSSSSGKRIEIDSINNRIDFYSANGVNTIRIDDSIYDAAPGIQIFNPLNTSQHLDLYYGGLILGGNVKLISIGGYCLFSLEGLLPAPTANFNFRMLIYDTATGNVTLNDNTNIPTKVGGATYKPLLVRTDLGDPGRIYLGDVE